MSVSMKGRTFPAESLTRAEIDALLEACGDTWAGVRLRTMIIVMWRSGLRLGETLALRPIDVDYLARTIRVLHGKGDKARTTAADRHELAVLDEWFEIRPKSELIFCTRKGGPIAQSYVRRALPKLAKKAGVERRVHAHMFRHTFAVELSRAGVPVRDIQQLLGHSSLATTSVYLASLSPEEALDHVRGREW